MSVFTQDILSVERATAGDAISANGIFRIYVDGMVTFLICAGPIVALVFVAAFAANVAQVGFVFSTEAIGFKFNRINPISGLKRMFSGKNAMNLIKSLAKVVVIGGIGYSYVQGKLADLMSLLGAEIGLIVRLGFDMVFGLAFRICGAMLALAFFDYAFQWWQYEKDLRMTKQEIKEEYKQMEGDPKIKSKIKEKQRQISMQRMMSEVPKADVVITNPTHYAVAVRYDAAVADAPIVLAKGAGYVARRIREVAAENGVEVIENKPLARALYEGVDIGAKIPQELYQAVAEVLAIVYKIKNKTID
jgi:flagellar biosynthetic protein FlhB